MQSSCPWLCIVLLLLLLEPDQAESGVFHGPTPAASRQLHVSSHTQSTNGIPASERAHAKTLSRRFNPPRKI